MSLPRRKIRALLAIACAVFTVLGWGLVGPGRLAAAALLEDDHCLEASLDDGHLDLRLGHRDESTHAHRHDGPTRPDHVIHLCAPSEWLPSKSSGLRPPAPLPAALSPKAPFVTSDDRRLDLARAVRSVDRSPPRSAPLLL